MKSPPHSDALVFFGATGDLAHKMIFPALQALVRKGRLAVPIVGVARAGNLEALRARAKDSLEKYGGGVDRAAFDKLSTLLRYVAGDYRDEHTFDALRQALGSAQRPLHYLAIPSSLFATVVRGLARAGAAQNARVVVEKPFGRDLASARQLNRTLGQVFAEEAIFRIDHFLGKEPVQNLLYFRFANSFLEPIWNRDHVASIEIALTESFGIKGRGRMYEETGAIRDVLQNHMLQILACLAMEPPTGSDAAAIRRAKTELLGAIEPLSPEDVVRGQFRGYYQESGVDPRSDVETFAAVRLAIDNPRWTGVPIYLRSGKRLAVTCTEVFASLQSVPRSVFGESLSLRDRNHVRFRLEPDVAIALGVRSKEPGDEMVGRDIELVAAHDPEGMLPYERLLGDALAGDPSLFAGQKAVEAEWRAVEGILDHRAPLHVYEPGTWGPREADRLVSDSGGWHNPEPPRSTAP